MVHTTRSLFLPQDKVRSPGREKATSIIDRSNLELLDPRRLKNLGEGDDFGGAIGEERSVNGSSEK